jgi:hypothetical protein
MYVFCREINDFTLSGAVPMTTHRMVATRLLTSMFILSTILTCTKSRNSRGMRTKSPGPRDKILRETSGTDKKPNLVSFQSVPIANQNLTLALSCRTSGSLGRESGPVLPKMDERGNRESDIRVLCAGTEDNEFRAVEEGASSDTRDCTVHTRTEMRPDSPVVR